MSARRASISAVLVTAAVASAAAPRELIAREYDAGFLPNPRWGRTTYTLTINDEAKATLRITLDRPVDALRKKMTLPFWEATCVDDTEFVGSWTRKGKRLSVTVESLTLECRPRRVEVHAANAAVAYVNNCTPCYDSACSKPPRWTPAKSRTMEVMVCAITGTSSLPLPETLTFAEGLGVERIFGDTDCPATGLREVVAD